LRALHLDQEDVIGHTAHNFLSHKVACEKEELIHRGFQGERVVYRSTCNIQNLSYVGKILPIFENDIVTHVIINLYYYHEELEKEAINLSSALQPIQRCRPTFYFNQSLLLN
jgi:hypothetical protein